MPKHVLLYDAFGWEIPVQAHLPTILDPSGKGKLSKRKKKLADGRTCSLTSTSSARAVPARGDGELSRPGGLVVRRGDRVLFRTALIERFTLERVNKSPAAFSYDKLDHMNATYIRSLGPSDLAGRLLRVLLDAGLPADIDQALQMVPLVRERLKTLPAVLPLVDFVYGDLPAFDPVTLIQKKMDRAGTAAALRAAREALAGMATFEEEALEERLRALADELGLKAGALFGALRVAVTGRTVSPPLFGTLAVIGREKVLARLGQAEGRLQEAA